MKIAYIVTTAHPIGGAQIHIRDLVISLAAQGHECTVMTGGAGLFVDMLRAAHVPTRQLTDLVVPIRPIRDVRALREIRAGVRQCAPDLIAAHSSKAGILARIAGRSLGIPVVLTAHGWSFTPGVAPLSATMYRLIERSAGPLAAKIITVSEFDRRLALEAGVSTADRLVTVYNGIDDVPLALRAEPGRRPVRLIMVARFGAQKDHPTLFRALAGLTDEPWELDLVGDGPQMPQAKAMAGSLGLGDRIRFLGQRKDVGELLANAQVSVLATNWEGFPLSILESMRAGLPMVATDVAGVAESVTDGESGYLVPRGDADLLRDRIRRLLSDGELRQQLGASGRARYERDFTLTEFVRHTLAVYEDVLAG